MGLIELVHLVCGGVNGEGVVNPVNCGVGLRKPRESKDNVPFFAVHAMEKNFVEDTSDVNI